MAGASIQLNVGRGIGGKLFLSFFFFAFLAMGLIFTGLVVRQVYIDTKTYGWPKVECLVLESGVRDKGGNSPYEFVVHYQYQWKGQSYSSQRFKTQNQSFSSYGDAQRLVERYRGSTKATCYIDPHDPAQAILQRSSLWLGLLIFLPLIFVAVGAGGIYFVWKRASPPTGPAPIVLKPTALKTRKPIVAFCSLFIVVGLLVFYAIFIRPVIKIREARHWPAVPCTVVLSRVQSHNSDDGTTYSVDILYRYEISGREYKANRYNFFGGSSSGYNGKARIVSQYPPGRETVCYVNPQDPTDAVLFRSFTPTMWFGLLPLLFVVAGAAGIIANPPGGTPPAKLSVSFELSPVVLKARYSPAARFFGSVCISVLWNGIVSVFLWLVIQMWMGREHGPKWFLTFFLIPFVLVGLLMIWMTVHAFVGLFSPRAQLRIDSSTIPLGNSVEIQWQFSGRVEKIREFRLFLEGREEVDERSGDNFRTNKSVFHTSDIIHLTDSKSIPSGSALCTIPADQKPSDAEGDHRVVWVIRLKANVHRGADLDDEYLITVISAAATDNRLAAVG
jgi:hypothetical protein